MRVTRALVALAVSGAVVACSFVVRSDREQCETDADCIGHGLPAGAVCAEDHACRMSGGLVVDGAADAESDDPIWGCVGRLPLLPVADISVPIHFHARFESLTAQPLVGLAVKACSQLDLPCATALGGTPKDTDGTGAVDITLYNGFRGYLEVGPSAAFPTLLPTLSYVLPIPDKTRPVGEPGPDNPRFATPTLTAEELETYADAVGKKANPEFAHLLYRVLDCQGDPAPDTSLRAETVTPDTSAFYLEAEGKPSLTQGKTGGSGRGGFLNLPTGSVTIEFRRSQGGALGSQTVLTRKGTVTYALFLPSR